MKDIHTKSDRHLLEAQVQLAEETLRFQRKNAVALTAIAGLIAFVNPCNEVKEIIQIMHKEIKELNP